MKIINLDINSIQPYEQNPRYNEQAVDAIAKSIELYGWRSPIIVDKNNVIICGHTRHKAAKKLGLKEVPCIIADHLSNDLVKAYRIADNRLAELSTWNYEALQIELADLEDAGVDMSLLDFDIVDMAAPIDDDEDEIKIGKTHADSLPTDTEQERSQKNETYNLDAHRLICSSILDLHALSSLRPILFFANLQKRNEESISACMEVISKVVSGCSFYIFVSPGQERNIYEFLVEQGIDVTALYLIKKSSVSGKQDYQIQAETCFFGNRDGIWTVAEPVSNLFYNEIKAKRSASKPTDLLMNFIKNSSNKNDTVLSMFDEDGSMLLACEQLGRYCTAVEPDPKKCDIIRKRFAEFREGVNCDWEQLTPAIKKGVKNERKN